MKLRNKFGDSINIKPTHWWNILDWIEVYSFWRKFRNSKLKINTKDWRWSYGSSNDR